jgi:hypothetical protein
VNIKYLHKNVLEKQIQTVEQKHRNKRLQRTNYTVTYKITWHYKILENLVKGCRWPYGFKNVLKGKIKTLKSKIKK